MRKLSIFLIALMCTTLMSAKSYTQQGIAYLYDYKTKTKKPIANVSLTVAGAQPTVSKADGTFTLVFDDYGLGDKIGFEKQPYYQGMKVFNKKEVDNWFIVKDRLRLIMCRYEEFELAKNNFYQQGLKAATEKYEKEIAKIKADQKLKEAEKNQQLQEAEEHLQKVMESLSETSEAMARIDQSELDAQMQEVLDLYEQGEASKALEKLDNMKLKESLEQSLKDKAIHQAALQTAIEDSIKAIQNIRSAIELYKNNYDWEQVVKYQKILADCIQIPDDLFEYAYLCESHGINETDIEPYYAKVLETTKTSKETNLSHLLLNATAFHNLGNIYDRRGEFDKGVKFLQEGLEGRLQYAKRSNNPNDAGHVAWALISLGYSYLNQGKVKESKFYYDKAKEIYQRIVPMNPDEHEWADGRLHQYYGEFYMYENDSIQAIQHFTTALEIFRRRVSQNPVLFVGHMNNIIKKLCILLDQQQRYEESEQYQKELIKWYQTYMPQYPKALKEDYAVALSNLADFLARNTRYTDAIPYFEECAKIYKELAKDNSNEGDFLFVLSGLSQLYTLTENYTKAYQTNITFLSLNKERYLQDEENWGELYAQVLGNQSFCAISLKKYSEAEQLAREGLSVDSTQHFIEINLAMSQYLLRKCSAEQLMAVYRKNKNELKDLCLDGFRRLESAGVIPKEREEDVERIKKMLNE